MRKTTLALATMLLTGCFGAHNRGDGDDASVPPRSRADSSPYPSVSTPNADAGDDITVLMGGTASLDGSGSRDPDGLELSYAWTITAHPPGSSASLVGADRVAPTLVADTLGDFEVSLVVNNSTVSSAPDTVIVTAVLPDGVGSGILDPDEVYLLGTLAEGSARRAAVAHYLAPDRPVVGFTRIHRRNAQVRSDGTLIYMNTFEDILREFHCDACPGFSRGDSYPRDVLANDTILPTPPCDPDVPRMELRDFLLGPDGRRIHRCGVSRTWYDPSGAVVASGVTPLVLGWDDHALLNGAVLDLASGATTTITGLPTDPACRTIARRADASGGFLVGIDCMSGGTTLHSITHEGVATLEGVYPAPPSGYTIRLEQRISGDRALVSFALGPSAAEDAIIRRTIEGVSEVVYTEEMTPSPTVLIHISGLVSGP